MQATMHLIWPKGEACKDWLPINNYTRFLTQINDHKKDTTVVFLHKLYTMRRPQETTTLRNFDFDIQDKIIIYGIVYKDTLQY